MRRFSMLLSVVVVVLLGSASVLSRPSASAQEATPAGQTRPTQPTQPEAGPGGAQTAFPSARAVKYGPEPGGFWIWEPTTAEGEAPDGGTFPVVFYLSGWCAECTWPTPEDVDPWLSHLARQGQVVVAPVYNPPMAMADAGALIKEALAELESPGHAQVDATRSAMIGFSYGGGVALLLAASAAAEGIPVPQALFLTAPCASCHEMPAEAPALPDGMKAIVITYDNDLSYHDDAELIWELLASVPDEDRDFVMMGSDSHGRPPLWAVHKTTNNEVDAADWYGVWKLSDALLACTFSGEWCEYALGDTPEQRFMGTWSDGVPVEELIVSDDPVGL
jgi:acetyl esterase/lipase